MILYTRVIRAEAWDFYGGILKSEVNDEDERLRIIGDLIENLVESP